MSKHARGIKCALNSQERQQNPNCRLHLQVFTVRSQVVVCPLLWKHELCSVKRGLNRFSPCEKGGVTQAGLCGPGSLSTAGGVGSATRRHGDESDGHEDKGTVTIDCRQGGIYRLLVMSSASSSDVSAVASKLRDDDASKRHLETQDRKAAELSGGGSYRIMSTELRFGAIYTFPVM